MVTGQKDTTLRIAARLRRARELAGLSQSGVADHLGVAANTVCGWECGDRMPRAPELVALGELYGCTSDYLLARSDYSTGLPVGELLVDQELVDRVLRAQTAAELEELVDWHPQFIGFWHVVNNGTRVWTRRHVQSLTFRLMSHVQKIAPELWQTYELAVQDIRRRQSQWERHRGEEENGSQSYG